VTTTTLLLPLVGRQAAAEARATGRPARSHRRAAVADRQAAARHIRRELAALRVVTTR